jgi:hypothetical protein
MTDFEIKNNLLNEIKELANKKYGKDNTYHVLWGSASALLTKEQLEIMKSVFS